MPPARKISRVWSFFTRQSDGNAICHVCGRSLSHKSTTTNLAKHLHRKHPTVFNSDEDPREGLKEFITLDGAETFQEEEDTQDAPIKEPTDTEWTPPKKFQRKSAPQILQKKVKPEIFTANNVEYLIYPSHEPTRPNRLSAPPVQKSGPSDAKTDEDEFSIFARFLAQRVRTLKDPYWQSCAINEINTALHKVEMRRYEPPKAFVGSDFATQTDSQEQALSIRSFNAVTSGVSQEQMRTDVVEEIVTSHEVVENFE
ncbi:ZnF_BED [Nesidiocoris tenuis]|uniref:ZnF_BED n=1 Tax=Nesidiocoris tenuis TaxID=355587 RepID=A0ABN7BE95_9HEMI|nr:ZnF_BED [Nesidiocoris tenuis]